MSDGTWVIEEYETEQPKKEFSLIELHFLMKKARLATGEVCTLINRGRNYEISD